MDKISLNFKEIKTMIKSIFPEDKAEILATKLKDILIIKDYLLYELKNEIIYECSELRKSKLQSTVSSILTRSYKALKDDDVKKLQLLDKYMNIFKLSNIDSYLPLLITKLEAETTFDIYKNEIHYQNGYYDLSSNSFKKRVKGTHYITKYIKRSYVKSTVEQRNLIYHHVSKIINNKDDLNIL